MARRRWFVRPYSGMIGAWLRLGKPLVSGMSALFRPRSPVDLSTPFGFSELEKLRPATIGELAVWLAQRTDWISDPLDGLLDYFPSPENIEWQLTHGDGIFRDDCDGLAYLTALAARSFCDAPHENYLVTVIYDPTEVPIEGSAHVLHLFRHRGDWRIFSNAQLDVKAWESPCEALYDNSYYHGWCNGAVPTYIEVRDPQLSLVATGLDQVSRLWGCDVLSNPDPRG